MNIDEINIEELKDKSLYQLLKDVDLSTYKVGHKDFKTPVNLYTQNVYTGQNKSILNIVSLFVPTFSHNVLTPLQSGKLGGKIIPSGNHYFNLNEIKEHLPKVNKENYEEFRKDIFDLYLSKKIKNIHNINVDNIKNDNEHIELRGAWKVPIKKYTPLLVYYNEQQALANNLDTQYAVMKDYYKPKEKRLLDYSKEKNDYCTEELSMSKTNYYHVVSIMDVLYVDEEFLQLNFIENFEKLDISKYSQEELDYFKDEVIKIADALDVSLKIGDNDTGVNHYRPSTKTITLNNIRTFHSPNNFLATFFHELGHAISDRNENGNSYAKDELLVELSSANIMEKVAYSRESTIPYIASWMQSEISSEEEFDKEYANITEQMRAIQKEIFDKTNLTNGYFRDALKFNKLQNQTIALISAKAGDTFYRRYKIKSNVPLNVHDFGKVQYDAYKTNFSFSKLKPILINTLNELKATYQEKDLFNGNGYNLEHLDKLLTDISDKDKKNIKSKFTNNYFELKTQMEVHKLVSRDIDKEKFELIDFKSIVARAKIEDIANLLPKYLADDLTSVVNEDNKISYKKNVNATLKKVYEYIKEDAFAKEKFLNEDFNKGINKSEQISK